MEKAKKWLTKDNLFIMILCGGLILIALWPTDRARKTEAVQMQTQAETETTKESKEFRTEMEAELQDMLQLMEGVGKVRVMITVRQPEESKAKAGDSLWGGGRAESTSHVRVEGLLVLAQGAENAKVREDITEAAKALFDVEANKVKVAVLRTSGH